MARTKKGVGYARYSKLGTRDEEALITLDVQHDTIDTVARDMGIPIVARFEDRSKSGGSLDRAGLQDALKMIEDGDADTLVVARLSRLARSAVGAHEALQRITDAGGKLVCGDLMVDLKSPTGQLMFTMFAAFAQFERDLKTEDWALATRSSLARGVKVGAVPVGYEKEKRERLLVNEKYRDAVREVFQLRAERHPWSVVRARWEELTGEARAASTFAAMVKSRTYLGELHYGDITVVDAHEPLIDEATWQRAQSTSTKRGLRKPRGDGSLLAGLLVCSGCGGKMTNAGTKARPVYACQRVRHGHVCEQPVQINRPNLDAYVEQVVLDHVGQDGATWTGEADVEEMRQLDEERAQLVARRSRLSTMLADITQDETALVEGITAIDARVEQIDERRAELLARSGDDVAVARIADLWPSWDVQTQRRHLSLILDRIVVGSSRDEAGVVNRAATVESRVPLSSFVWK